MLSILIFPRLRDGTKCRTGPIFGRSKNHRRLIIQLMQQISTIPRLYFRAFRCLRFTIYCQDSSIMLVLRLILRVAELML